MFVHGQLDSGEGANPQGTFFPVDLDDFEVFEAQLVLFVLNKIEFLKHGNVLCFVTVLLKN